MTERRKHSDFFSERHLKTAAFLLSMSFVHLVIVHKNTVYQLNVHYRTALRLLKQGPEEFFRFLPGKYRDAGYLVVDYDKKMLINGQEAFALPPKTGLEVMHV